MVKADLARDYYGDLEIAPTADLAEIKKQFKKLGMVTTKPGVGLRIAQLTSASQLSHTTPIETQDERPKSPPNSS